LFTWIPAFAGMTPTQGITHQGLNRKREVNSCQDSTTNAPPKSHACSRQELAGKHQIKSHYILLLFATIY